MSGLSPVEPAYMTLIDFLFSFPRLDTMQVVAGGSRYFYGAPGPTMVGFTDQYEAMHDSNYVFTDTMTFLKYSYRGTAGDYNVWHNTGGVLAGARQYDLWNGACYINWRGRKAVVVVGNKQYGFYRYLSGTGPIATEFRAMMLLYDPNKLIAVSNGTLPSDSVQPYAAVDMENLGNLYNANQTDWKGREGLTGIDWDSVSGRIFITESNPTGNTNASSVVIHVFQMDTSVGSDNPPTVTTNPSPATVTAPDTATFISHATADTVRQWQRYDGESWTNETGKTTDTLKFATTPSMNGDSLRCIFLNYHGADTSVAARLTVNENEYDTIQIFGNSISAGYQTACSYSCSLQDLLGLYKWKFVGVNSYSGITAPYEAAHSAFAGERSADILSRVRAYSYAYMSATSADTQIAIIMTGTNDVNNIADTLNFPAFIDTVERMIDTLKYHNSDIIPVICQVPAFTDTRDVRAVAWNRLLEEMVTEKLSQYPDIRFAHVHDSIVAVSSWQSLYYDEIHPDDDMMPHIAGAVYDAINNPLEAPPDSFTITVTENPAEAFTYSVRPEKQETGLPCSLIVTVATGYVGEGLSVDTTCTISPTGSDTIIWPALSGNKSVTINGHAWPTYTRDTVIVGSATVEVSPGELTPVDSATPCTTSVFLIPEGYRLDSIVSMGATRHVAYYPATLITYVMTENRIDSIFINELPVIPDSSTLTLTQTSGGTVSADPAATKRAAGDQSVITAVADLQYHFVTWQGDLADSTGNPLAYTYGATGSFTGSALFGPDTIAIDTAIVGSGYFTLTQNGGGDPALYPYGTVVITHAYPDAGFALASWTGVLTGNEVIDSFTAVAAIPVIATFGEIPVIDSIHSLIQRDKYRLNAARRTDPVSFVMSTDIGDSTDLSAVYLGRDTTGLMIMVGWYNNTEGKDSIVCLVNPDATLNKNFRPIVVSGLGIYSVVRTPVTWREQWILNVKGQVVP